MSIVTHSIGNKEFVLDQEKAEAAFSAKKIINGRDTMTFNLLPLKYKWAYEIYKNMPQSILLFMRLILIKNTLVFLPMFFLII